MTTPQLMFDRAAILQNRKRAMQMGFADFLHREALFEVEERLLDVNRQFTSPAIVTGFPKFWANAVPNAVIVEDSDVLTLKPAAHDLVIHAMCLHQSNDLVGQIIQSRRALTPDGLFLGVMLGGQTLHELRAALGQAEVALTGGLSPRVAQMAEIRDLGSVLQRSGLALPVADTVKKRVLYGAFLDLLRDLRAMGETNALAARMKSFAKPKLFSQAARIYQQAFTETDKIAATFELIFLTGWAPSADQPQPLKPGSAKTRLADALHTTELGADAKPAKAR